MHFVRSPQHTDFVAQAVRPVVAEIVGHQRAQPDPQVIGRQGGEAPVLVHGGVSAQHNQLDQHADDLTDHTQMQAGEGIGGIVHGSSAPLRYPGFEHDGEHKNRDSQYDGIHRADDRLGRNDYAYIHANSTRISGNTDVYDTQMASDKVNLASLMNPVLARWASRWRH